MLDSAVTFIWKRDLIPPLVDVKVTDLSTYFMLNDVNIVIMSTYCKSL